MALHLRPCSEQTENMQTHSAALHRVRGSPELCHCLPHLYGMHYENRWSKGKGLGLELYASNFVLQPVPHPLCTFTFPPALARPDQSGSRAAASWGHAHGRRGGMATCSPAPSALPSRPWHRQPAGRGSGTGLLVVEDEEGRLQAGSCLPHHLHRSHKQAKVGVRPAHKQAATPGKPGDVG